MTGVGIDEIYKYVPTHLVRARRCPILANDLARSYDVVVAALIRMNRLYSFHMAAELWISSIMGFWKLHYAMAGPLSHICSHLYADAFSQATERPLQNGGGKIPTPAHLSAASVLVDVASKWKRLAN